MNLEAAKWAASLPHPDDTAAWDARIREVFGLAGVPQTPAPLPETDPAALAEVSK